MKQKDRIVSSVIIALVAGFIYYAFGESEVIRRIPQLAYETVKSVISPEKANSDLTLDNNKNLTMVVKEENENTYNNEQFSAIFEEAEYAQLPDLSLLMRLRSEGDVAFLSNKHLTDLEKLDELGNIDVLPTDFMQYVNYLPDMVPLDSGRIKIKVKIENMDSLNVFIDKSMMKLNESLTKLNEQLKSENFMKNIPEIDEDDIDVDIDVDVDDIKESVKESMKEFEENMKEFDFDMKEFKDSMKKFNESMEELKKNMKDMDSNYMKRMDKKIEIIES
ncbi:MAG: hypothetical protein WC644_03250 [Ignavibacteria bacterium]